MSIGQLVEYSNPITPGFNPDPSIVFVDGIFYLATSSFHVFPGLPIYASRDLKKWIHIGNAINRPEQLDLSKGSMVKVPLDTGHFMVGAGGLFAPTIRYHEGKFYIICTNFGEFKEPFEIQNFIISCTDIWAGNWSDPVNVEFNGIDPSLYFEDDGRVYFQGCFMMSRTKQPTCTIKQFEIDVETGKHLSEEREIWGGHARYDTEGPHIYKIGKWYYLLVAEGGTFEHHMLCISRSENIWGPYEDYEQNPIMTADGTGEYIQNIGHGELFQDGEGQWWVVGLGVRNENEGEPLCKDNFVAPLGRESFLAPVEWREGGWPKVFQPKMKFSARPVKTAEGLPELIAPDNVDNLYIRTPNFSKYDIPQDGTAPLTLYPSTTNLSAPTGTSTFLGRRQLSLNASSITTLEISSLECGIEAGLALYKDHLRHVSISFESTSKKITCRLTNLDKDNELLGEMAVGAEAQLVELKIQADPKKWTFSARTVPKVGSKLEWIELGVVEAWKMVAREMTGPLFGVFAHTSQEKESASVRFLDFLTEV
ncbi:hypothetical protein NW762_005446 [Fusarium torreyae]|uniref:Beta-xylosidase C-terminal Concanavalin A-like domain-containing protein n=1 Tax=Fusarium torreyae TaxID=1237075 RepID=A0A9W8S1N8_9HYPO|nr:hypothetical protein NW762_005446 [Fusarium torreyae]